MSARLGQPQIFRLDDPCVRLRLSPDGRHELEKILAGLPAEVFVADDALGWVYQYWQKDKKDEVNNSERKIGGADLGPVTQLFTENYMVRFLLENSLGAWWAARHPNSPLVAEWEFLRFDDNGEPAAGRFEGWPERVAEVTVMDPCCGSGHFLVEAFSMLWQMRAEDEQLDPVVAQDAVLRDNLFGLELDPRCVQIAMFAVALQAWKAGGGWRLLPTPNVACSGIPVRAPVDEWAALAGGDERLENALTRLHILFRDADTLGSLIDPKRATEISDRTGLQQSFEDVDWDDIAPLLQKAVSAEADDPATAVLGADATGIARAADYLSRHYTLIATNVPYLGGGKQDETLAGHLARFHAHARRDLATAMLERCVSLARRGGGACLVTPETWLFLRSYSTFRRSVLAGSRWRGCATLGDGAFGEITGAVVRAILLLLENREPTSDADFMFLDSSHANGVPAKRETLVSGELAWVLQGGQLANPESRITFHSSSVKTLLGEYADTLHGLGTFDAPQYTFCFWELASIDHGWVPEQSAPRESRTVDGCDSALRWEDGTGRLAGEMAERAANGYSSGKWRAGRPVWGKRGIAVWTMDRLVYNLYLGTAFDENVTAIVPHDEKLLPAVWAFADSGQLEREARKLDKKLHITPNTYSKIPFDLDHWREVAAERFPDRLPEPWSDDPTQWLFEGRPEVSTEPLQVAVGRLVGFRWPEQAESDDLDRFADDDGIVCLPAVAGEAPAADRVQQLLAAAYGDRWSPSMVTSLVADTGSKKKNLTDWLRDEFFKHHCAVFQNRPFVWHVWDGLRDGFSALVNYHRLDRKMLEKLTYTYLGTDWVERQRAGVRDGVTGAEGRLAAALELQRKLELILEGETPFDIYVRWKRLAEQPIGWDPDLNDGVRLNIRPFVEAGVLRSKFNIHWRKDRGKNPDGTERHNDIHLTLTDKTAARTGGSR